MAFLIIFLIIIAVIILSIPVAFCVCDWESDSPGCAPKIKFKSFEKFYWVNPDRWILEDGYVKCKMGESKSYKGLFLDSTTEKFGFGFFDYYKYKKFKNKIYKDKMKRKKMKITAEMLKVVKEDIANMEDLAEQQKKHAMDNINVILNGL